MTDLREFSRLPDDEAYWASLEARVVEAAGVPGPPTLMVRPTWRDALAARAWSLGGLAAAAAIATLLLVPPPPAPSADDTALTLIGAPSDKPALLRFAATPVPPSLAALLVPGAAERTR